MKKFSKILGIVLCLVLAVSLMTTIATAADATTVSVSIKDCAAANGWTNGTQYSTFNLDSVVTVSATGTPVGSWGLNTGKFYTSNSSWRIYQNENPSVVISAGECNIVSVKITYSANKGGVLTLDGAQIESAQIVEVNAPSVTFSVANTGSATNGQAQITAIEVTYAEAQPAVPGQPVCEHAVEDHMAIDVAPTCTEYGFTLHVCTVEGCDGSYADNYVDALGHDFGEATCMQAATCTRCGETSGELGAHNITAKNEEIIYPTCTEEGLAAYWYCGDCCTYFADAECTVKMEDQTGLNLAIPATGHNIVAKNEEYIYPTCTEEGVIAYWYCGDCCTYFANAECTEEMEDQTGLNLTVAPTGHNIVAKNEEIIYPTCTEEGLAAYWYCGDCCTYFANAECTEELEDQTGLNLAIAATGHNIVAKNEEYIYPTCTEEGVIAYWYCGDCCTYFANAECTEEMEDQTGLNLTVAPTGHNIVAKNEEIIYPTCTEEGLAAYWYCGDCCTYFANAECTEELEDQTGLNLAIPATGHNITSSSEGFEATETEDGMIEYYYCGDCCTYFHDAECTEKMEDQTGLNLVIPAKGTSDSPDTGDNTVVLFVVFAMVVMTGLTVMVCKKKYF